MIHLQQRKPEHSTSKASLGVGGLLTTPSRSLSKIKMPTPDAYKRIHLETFPHLDGGLIERLLVASSQQNSGLLNQEASTPKNHLCRPHLVPYGPPIETVRNMTFINKALVDLTDSNSINAQQSFDELRPKDGEEFNWETGCIRKLEAISQVTSNLFEMICGHVRGSIC